MAVSLKRKKQQPKALTASVVTPVFDDPAWHALTYEAAWESELWRLYTCVPEFSRGANWVGQACSRVRIYVAEVDSRGQVQKEVPDTNPVGRLSRNVLGGPTKRADLLRLAGVDQVVVGQFWLVAFSVAASEDDRWAIVTSSELKRIENYLGSPGSDPYIDAIFRMPPEARPEVYELRVGTRQPRYLVEGRDIVARVWTPYPPNTWEADSPGRSLQMVLVELEILTQYILAQARSRLASGGILLWPTETEFPTADGEPVGAESVMQRMSDAAQTNLSKFGGASQILPMLIEMKADLIEKMKDPIMFGTILSEQAMNLRKELRERLASGLDVQPEVIMGMGDATRWNGPQIEQTTVDTVINPIMTRICDALTEVYLIPALKRLGLDTKKYRFWFDTAALVTRPNRLKETLEMYMQQLVGWEEVLKAADLPDSAHMSDKEREQILAQKLLLSDSNMILIPELRKLAGINIASVAPDGQPIGDSTEAVAGRAPAPPPPERTLQLGNRGGQPQLSEDSQAPNNATPGSQNRRPREERARDSLTASANTDPMVIVGDQLVRQTLEKVGKHLSRNNGRPTVPYDQVYLTASVDGMAHATALVTARFGALGALGDVLGSQADSYRDTLIHYTATLVAERQPHQPRIMRGHLERQGLL